MEELLDLLARALPIVQDAAEFDPHLSERGRKRLASLAREIERAIRMYETDKGGENGTDK